MRQGTSTISFFPGSQVPDVVTNLRDCGVTSYAMEFVPRIFRAQSMDALSSQALDAGYRSVIVAAGLLRRFLPLNMTAAGTVQPAEVVVLGAGVAGLQVVQFASFGTVRCRTRTWGWAYPVKSSGWLARATLVRWMCRARTFEAVSASRAARASMRSRCSALMVLEPSRPASRV